MAVGAWLGEVGEIAGSYFFAASGMAEVTLSDRVFLAAGPSFGQVSPVDDPLKGVHLRVGGYPFLKRNPTTGRRHGLAMGVDLRVYAVSDATVVAPTGTLSWQAF